MADQALWLHREVQILAAGLRVGSALPAGTCSAQEEVFSEQPPRPGVLRRTDAEAAGIRWGLFESAVWRGPRAPIHGDGIRIVQRPEEAALNVHRWRCS